MKTRILFLMMIAAASLLGMSSCDKISEATKVEKTFTMTIPPTEFTYTDTTTVKSSSGYKLIYTRPMMFNIADSLKKYGLTGTMSINAVRPKLLLISSGDGTSLAWSQAMFAKASPIGGEGKIFGIGSTGVAQMVAFAFEGFSMVIAPDSVKQKATQEQPLAFEIMKSFPYLLQVYAITSGTVTMPKTVNLIISGEFEIATDIKL